MCGICGHTHDPEGAAARAMNAAMVHRGPDDEGVHGDAASGVASARGGSASSTSRAATSRSPTRTARSGRCSTARSTTTRACRSCCASAATRCATRHRHRGPRPPLRGVRRRPRARARGDVRLRHLGLARAGRCWSPATASARSRSSTPSGDGRPRLRLGADRARRRRPSSAAELDPVAVDAFFVFGYVPGERSHRRRASAQLPPGHLLSWEPARGAGGARATGSPPAAAVGERRRVDSPTWSARSAACSRTRCGAADRRRAARRLPQRRRRLDAGRRARRARLQPPDQDLHGRLRRRRASTRREAARATAARARRRAPRADPHGGRGRATACPALLRGARPAARRPGAARAPRDRRLRPRVGHGRGRRRGRRRALRRLPALPLARARRGARRRPAGVAGRPAARLPGAPRSRPAGSARLADVARAARRSTASATSTGSPRAAGSCAPASTGPRLRGSADSRPALAGRPRRPGRRRRPLGRRPLHAARPAALAARTTCSPRPTAPACSSRSSCARRILNRELAEFAATVPPRPRTAAARARCCCGRCSTRAAAGDACEARQDRLPRAGRRLAARPAARRSCATQLRSSGHVCEEGWFDRAAASRLLDRAPQPARTTAATRCGRSSPSASGSTACGARDGVAR